MPTPSPPMDEKQLEEAGYFAALLLSDQELDDLLELPSGSVSRAVLNRDSTLGRAVRAGRLRTKCELHESILTTARRHSTPAQQMAADLLRKLDIQ